MDSIIEFSRKNRELIEQARLMKEVLDEREFVPTLRSVLEAKGMTEDEIGIILLLSSVTVEILRF